MGGTRAERKRRKEKKKSEERTESAELSRTPGFMGGTRAESWADHWGIIS